MPEIHLRQPQFTNSACGPFTKHEQRIQKFKETGDTNYIYKNELDKACFVHDSSVKWGHLAHFESNLAKHNFLNQNPMVSSSTL